MSFDFKGKVALVTGGASGIGLAYVKELLVNGCRGVAILDINAELANEVLEVLKSKFGKDRVIFLQVDVTNGTELKGAFQTTVDIFKFLDIVINNAGIFNENDFEKTINVNLIAVVRGTKLALEQFLPKYKSSDEAIIVNTSSIGALMFYEPSPIYVSTKFGVILLGKSLGSDYEKTKIRVLTICPGPTQTPLLSIVWDASPTVREDAEKLFDMDNIQTAEQLGKALIAVIKEGKSGSVWIADQKPVYEFQIEPMLKQPF